MLKKSDKKTDVVEYEQGIFEIITDLEVWDIRRIQLTMELALSYEARKDYCMVEELYVTLWRRLLEQCHHSHQHHGVEIHIRTIEVAIEYIRFLRRCNRQEEACNVLICLWNEYSEHDFESETIFLRLKTVGELLRAVSLLSVAVSVFKKCCTWFKVRGRFEHFASCEVLITETVEEIKRECITTVSTSRKTSTTVSVSSSTETVIRETFESSLSQKEVTTETISVCKSLIACYMESEQWSEAVEITRRSLAHCWKFIISGAGTCALPQNHGGDVIDIALNLAICYYQSHRFYEAEEIYVRVYRACWKSCHVEDARFVKCYETLAKFYEEHHQWHRMIQVYQELVVQYRKVLGPSHKLTIRTLYLLGSLCAEHGHGHSHEYYEEIVTTLNHGLTVCHADALDAMFVLCRVHFEAGHWHQLQLVCKTLWATWRVQHDRQGTFSAENVELLFLRYRCVLEREGCEYAFLRQLTVQYRETCIQVFGIAVAISIKASIELAQISMRSETYVHEAISIYEEVLTTIKTTTVESMTTRVLSESTILTNLSRAYILVCQSESASTTIVERAVIRVRQRFETLRVSLGWAHAETLVCLREMIFLQMKIKKQESRAITIRVLGETCVEIIRNEKHSETLHEAAKLISGIYISCGLTEQGQAIIDDIRLQIITGASSSISSIKLDRSVGRVAFVFLVTFEQIVRGQMITYSEIMADLLTETFLYESYHRSMKAEAGSSTVVCVARLRAFLLSHGRVVQRELLEREALTIFTKKWHSVLKTREETIRVFLLGLLGELGQDLRDVQIGDAACASSVTTVKHLLNKGQVQEAWEVATCALDFINHQQAFHIVRNVPYGFKLSALMVGRGLESPCKADTKLRDDMLELSRKIIREVLKACKDSDIQFIRMQLRELNDLAGLLGEQRNFADLEWLLDLLWSSREIQKNWKTATIIAVGQRFVEARYLNKDHRDRAIRLCEDICYNLRRVHGPLDTQTLKVSTLLSELYTSLGHYREAQGVHETILRRVVEGDDDDDSTTDTIPAAEARKHIDLLKQSYLRLKGWDKTPSNYHQLIASLMKLYKSEPSFAGVTNIEKWDHTKEAPSDHLGKFHAPTEWEFVRPDQVNKTGDSMIDDTISLRRPGLGVKRATSNWGIGEVMRVLSGNGGGEKSSPLPKWRGQTISQQKHQPNLEAKAVNGDEDDGFESAEEGTNAGVKDSGIKA